MAAVDASKKRWTRHMLSSFEQMQMKCQIVAAQIASAEIAAAQTVDSQTAVVQTDAAQIVAELLQQALMSLNLEGV